MARRGGKGGKTVRGRNRNSGGTTNGNGGNTPKLSVKTNDKGQIWRDCSIITGDC